MSERDGDKAQFAKARKKRLRHRENMKALRGPAADKPSADPKRKSG
jgi:hypothetical protein